MSETTVSPETLKKSYNEAMEELEQSPALRKAVGDEDDEILDDDILDELSEDEEEEELSKSQKEDRVLDAARAILKARKGKKKKGVRDMDDDYTDDEIDDDDGMGKAHDPGNPDMESRRDKAVMAAGKDMNTIIYFRKSIKTLGEAINTQGQQIADLTEAMAQSFKLQKAVGDLVMSNADLTKAVKEDVETIGDQEQTSGSVRKAAKSNTGTGGQRTDFQNPKNGAEIVQFMEKSMKVVRDNSLPDAIIPMLESRLNALRANPDYDIFANGLEEFKPYFLTEEQKAS